MDDEDRDGKNGTGCFRRPSSGPDGPRDKRSNLINTDIEIYIREAARGLTPGQSAKTICPFCHATWEKSFDVRRRADKPHLLSFRCYRGKCAEGGVVADRAGATMYLNNEEAPMPEPTCGHMYSDRPGAWLTGVLDGRYRLTESMIRKHRLRQSDSTTLCMPWLDEAGQQRGWIEKRYEGARKSLTDHWDRTRPGCLAFPRIGQAYHALKMHPESFCVLVEDLLSAYRLQKVAETCDIHAYPVALIGADISSVDVALIDRLFHKGIICLDPDQWPVGALRVLDRFKPYAIDMRAVTMRADPKDTADDMLAYYLQEWDEDLNG